MLVTKSPLHEEVGFPWIPVNPAPSIEEGIDAAPGASEVGSFPPQLANWTTVAACATAVTAASTLLSYDRQIWNMDKDIQRDLLDVLALFHCHQPTVHARRLQTDQINLLHLKWPHRVKLGPAFPITKGFFDLVCQHPHARSKRND